MMTRHSILILAAILSSLCVAQQPKVTNAKLVARSAAAGLEQEINAIMKADAGPAWAGYSVPVVPGERHICCFDFNKLKHDPGCCGGCNLENESAGQLIGKSGDCQQLEAPKTFFVLLRTSNHQVGKAKAFSVDCGLDADGLTLYWLGEARSAESIALLEKLIGRFQNSGDEEITQEAISAIALHSDPAADAALDRLVARDQPAEVRQHAAFWLGTSRGHHGFEVLQQLVRGNESEDTMEQFVFAISESNDPEAQPELIRLARQDARSEVREKALFWLAQRAGRKVGSVITDAVEKDPDTDVKKKAVFALTQMPNDEGVPLLIEVARNNRNPVVRKEAIFWLGQSGDSRALDYIESILAK